MQTSWHVTRGRLPHHLLICGLAYVICGWAVGASVRGDDDVSDISAKPVTTAPSEVTGPTTQGVSDALGTLRPKAPAGSRIGVLTLSDGTKIEGRVWTTLDTPLRVWIEETKSYRDIDLSLIKRIDVHVLTEAMEDDWRWLKEGSDQKVYSGKKYPNVELAYKFTLVNDKVVEGTVVAPIYSFDGEKMRNWALYKKYKGKLDETLKDLVYIESITLGPSEGAGSTEKRTTKLPLIK